MWCRDSGRPLPGARSVGVRVVWCRDSGRPVTGERRIWIEWRGAVTRADPLLERTRSGLGRIPAVWLVIAGIASVQCGAAIAKDLFDLIPPTAMVWLRLLTSALIFLIAVRPRLSGRTRADWLVALSFGTSLMTMNWAIYQSFARIPLGIAVTIEFLGPLAVAIAGSRRPRDLIWVLLAGVGVALLGLHSRQVVSCRHRVRVARRRCLGVLHPAQRGDRQAMARTLRPRHRQRGRCASFSPGRRSPKRAHV